MARLAYQIRWHEVEGTRRWLTMGKYHKLRFDDYQAALDHVLALESGWRHKHNAKIVAVRISKKPCRTEAQVRRAERERIADSLHSGNAGQWLMLGQRVLVSKESHGSPVKQAQQIILEFDWPNPEKA